MKQWIMIAAAIGGFALQPAASAVAADYPVRPITLIVPQAPGGGNDVIARILAETMSRTLGQQIIVENRPGAGSNIATDAVAHSPPDGYTLLLVSTSATVSATFYQNLNFNFVRDIAPVAGIVRVPLVMVVNPSVPAKTVPEFIAYAQANPGKINMASVGNGTTPHMAGELFKMMAGIDMLHVPYRGASPALTDLLGGRAQVMFEGMLSLVGHAKDGKLRPLAVTTAARSNLFPDVPTVGEFLPGYEASVWFGIGAPRDTPAEIVDKLNKEINAGLADPALKARIGDLGGTPLTMSSAEFEKLIAADTEKWGKVVRAANITLETGR
jgi:tripartite-type tricarboxylate transporter receptor subunit TctC